MSFISALRKAVISMPIRAMSPSIPHHLSRTSVRWLSAEARDKIDGVVKSNPLVVFMKGTPDQPQCGFSRAVIQVLDVQGVPREKLTTFNVLDDPELRSGIKEYSEWPTVPQVYVKGDFVGGADIVIGMHTSGELEDLLEKAKLLPELPAGSSSTTTQS